MARETMAQRNARVEAERIAREAKEQAEYPKRMMIALERATQNFNFELTVTEQQFVLYQRDSTNSFTINPIWNREVWELYELEDEMEKMDQQRREEQRREIMRAAALNKLTAEEKKLLNLA